MESHYTNQESEMIDKHEMCYTKLWQECSSFTLSIHHISASQQKKMETYIHHEAVNRVSKYQKMAFNTFYNQLYVGLRMRKNINTVYTLVECMHASPEPVGLVGIDT